MAKKKRKPDQNKRKQAKLPRDLPDRRLMERAMQELVAGIQGQANQNTPLGKAQSLMYSAFEQTDERKRTQLAKDALAICPDCADAYVVLAEHARSRKEARHLYEQGVAAGERALGAEAFQRDVGHFWSVLDTRPYMRARLGLAHLLWSGGRREEAVQHLQDMLRLNPGDNQGVRYTLASFLLFLDRDNDLIRLLQKYDEPSATWEYTKALLVFRQHGNTPEARKLLTQAKKTNRHVPGYLTGENFPPAGRPGYYSPGDENEALNYVSGFLAAWKFTPGAVAWLRASIGKRKESAPQPKGPLGLIKKWLNKHLPQDFDIWQADFKQMPNWISIADEMMRPWAVLVTSRSNDLVLAHQMSDEIPSMALMWDTLVEAMQHPAAGQPHRPTELQVRADERWEALTPHLDEIGVNLVVCDELEEIDAVFSNMIAHVCGKPKPGLLDMPGVTAAQVGSLRGRSLFLPPSAVEKSGRRDGDQGRVR